MSQAAYSKNKNQQPLHSADFGLQSCRMVGCLFALTLAGEGEGGGWIHCTRVPVNFYLRTVHTYVHL